VLQFLQDEGVGTAAVIGRVVENQSERPNLNIVH
jgi:hypothetical protein